MIEVSVVEKVVEREVAHFRKKYFSKHFLSHIDKPDGLINRKINNIFGDKHGARKLVFIQHWFVH